MYLVWNGEGFGGYWGNGKTEESATDNWRSHGGSGEHLVMLVGDNFKDPFINDWGEPRGYPIEGADYDNLGVFDKKVWHVSARGKRTLIVEDGQPLPAFDEVNA